MCKKIFNFGLDNGAYGILREEEIEEMCQAYDTTVYSKELCSYSDLWDYASMYGDLEVGMYQIKDGMAEVVYNTEEEDWDIIHIPHLSIVA